MEKLTEMKQEPFKLSLTQHGRTISFELPHSELDYEAFNDAILALMEASGYNAKGLMEDLKEAIEEKLKE